jgi:hypothetical protein
VAFSGGIAVFFLDFLDQWDPKSPWHYEYIWPSGVGPRVAEPALMLIDPYPWSAPLEEVRLKKN